jgi:hypothetical protein
VWQFQELKAEHKIVGRSRGMLVAYHIAEGFWIVFGNGTAVGKEM